MADVKWIKITTDIFDDEKILMIESMPSADSIIVIWLKLLTFAGKQNNDGVFLMSNRIAYTDEMLACIFRRDINLVRLALQIFQQFGMIEIVDGVITIPNWGKHQNLDQMENRKEFMRNYMREYREKQKALTCKPNSKPNSKPNVRQADKIREDKNNKARSTRACARDFDEEESNLAGAAALCKAWPKRTWLNAKIRAAYEDCIAEGVTDIELMECLKMAKMSKQWEEEDGRFIPAIDKWLHERRFAPDLKKVRATRQRKATIDQRAKDDEEINALIYGGYEDDTE